MKSGTESCMGLSWPVGPALQGLIRVPAPCQAQRSKYNSSCCATPAAGDYVAWITNRGAGKARRAGRKGGQCYHRTAKHKDDHMRKGIRIFPALLLALISSTVHFAVAQPASSPLDGTGI